MTLKRWLLLGTFAGSFLTFSSYGDDYEDLVLMLEKKGIFTPQEAKALIEKHKERLAKEQKLQKEEVAELKKLKKLVGLKIGGVAYLHYDYTLKGTKKSEDDFNEFKVTRAYIDIRKYFNNVNYFRLTGDIYKPDNTSGYVFRLKYAYLNWEINKYLQTEIGLAHRPWIDWEEHHGWLHRYMDKTFIEDKTGAHLITSADLGIAFKGKYQNLGYMFGIYNGEGYHVAEDDHHFGKSIEGRLTYYLPQYGLTFSFHSAYIDNDNNYSSQEADKFILQPWVGFKNDYVLLAAQYIYDRESNYYISPTTDVTLDNQGWSVNFDLYLKRWLHRPVTIFGRYGFWNYDSKSGKPDRSQYLLGIEYTFNKHVKGGIAFKQVNYDRTPTGADRDYEQIIKSALQVKW